MVSRELRAEGCPAWISKITCHRFHSAHAQGWTGRTTSVTAQILNTDHILSRKSGNATEEGLLYHNSFLVPDSRQSKDLKNIGSTYQGPS